jgi:hypothetical protein
MFQFGSGLLFTNPNAGNLVPSGNPTPKQPLTLQEVSLEVSQQLVELKGQNKIADDVAPGDMKINGKFQFGRLDYDLFNQIMFADKQVAGVSTIIANEGPTNIPTTPFQITVVNSSVFSVDLGVKFSATGQALIRVPSGTPVTGQYKVSAGVYTFAAADVAKAVLISYAITNTNGNTYQVNNQLMGYGPVFELWLSEPYNPVTISAIGINNGLRLFACRSSKLTHATKRDNYVIPEIDFMAFATLSSQVAEFYQIAV